MTVADAANESGSFHLKGSGGYDQTISISDHAVVYHNAIGLWFKKVPIADTYSLSYIAGDGTEWVVFEDVPYETLHENA